jgi:hypothetical protein
MSKASHIMSRVNYHHLLNTYHDDLQTCPNGKPCSHCEVTFRVEAETHRKIRSFIQQKKEYGGSLKFDFRRRVLLENSITSGKYNSISMDRGGVDFHTHPALCLNDDTCALGVPSPMDLQNITLGSLFGTVAHLVYSREGTYLVQLSSSLMDKLRASLENITLFFGDIDRTFSGLHKDFLKHQREPYKSYARRFRRLARLAGFNVRLFKGNTVPRIKFRCMCNLLTSTQTMVPNVTVPIELEEVLQVSSK